MSTVIHRYRSARAQARRAARREVLVRAHARATAGPPEDPYARAFTLAGRP